MAAKLIVLLGQDNMACIFKLQGSLRNHDHGATLLQGDFSLKNLYHLLSIKADIWANFEVRFTQALSYSHKPDNLPCFNVLRPSLAISASLCQMLRTADCWHAWVGKNFIGPHGHKWWRLWGMEYDILSPWVCFRVMWSLAGLELGVAQPIVQTAPFRRCIRPCHLARLQKVGACRETSSRQRPQFREIA